jgi:chromosome segregation ATPase
MESLEDILKDNVNLVVDGKKVTLERSRLVFNEANLSRFIEEEAVWYDHFGNALADAEADLQNKEIEWDKVYSEKFAAQKDEGASDKLAEARAKADPAVQEAKKAIVEAKRNVKHLQQHLRAWDHCHANAQNRGNTLRKEMDKLGTDIKFGNNSYGSPGYNQSELDETLDSIIGKPQE